MGANGPAARRKTRALILGVAAVALACLTAACSQSGHVKTAVSSAAAGKSIQPTRPAVTHSAVVPPASAPAPSSAPSPSAAATAAPSPRHASATPTSTASGSSAPNSAALWIALAACAVLLVALVAWIARRSGRRSAAVTGWRAEAANAYAKGEALQDAISVAESPGALGAEDAAARWSDIQRRADDLAQDLYRLREVAPDDDARAVVSNVLASLHAVRTAMSAERVSPGVGRDRAAEVRARMSFFETSLRELRDPVGRPA
jgi:hypothetical protein